MIESIVERLRKIDLDLTPEEIADILWLGIQISRAAPSTPTTRIPEDAGSTKLLDTRILENFSSQITRLPLSQTSTTAYLSTSSQPERDNTPFPSKAIIFKTPEAPALRNPLLLARALRPLMQKFPSRTQTVLDEEATINRIADEAVWLPVERPAPERWFDLVMVVEESPSVAIWRKTIKEWRRLVKHHGAFRDVRTWYLREDDKAAWQLYPTSRLATTQSRPRNPKELLETSGQQLILLISDCVSSLWQQGEIYSLLKTWTKQSSVSILQLMPERYWERSVLGRGRFVQFGTFFPEPLNAQLQVETLPAWELPLELKTALKLPVITFDPDSLRRWAKVMTGSGNTLTTGVVFESSQAMARSRRQVASDLLSASQRVKRFRATASLPARQLAGLMAAAPVSLPVARLIQQTMLPNSGQVHLAEVFLSGLIHVADEADIKLDSEQIRYEFLPGVRELLLQTIPISEADEVLDRVSAYIARKAGLSIRSFDALLAMYPDLDEEKRRLIQPFAQVTPQVLRCLGGVYAEIANELEYSGARAGVGGDTRIPVTLKTFEFDVATVTIEEIVNQEALNSENTVELESFEFETIKINSSGQEIERAKGTVRYFIEYLSREVNNREPIQVFFSYSHQDEDLREALGVHLALLKRQNVIAMWHDRRVVSESDLFTGINSNLQSATVMLLLVSASFLASDYCYGSEIQQAMERHARGEARVIPIILKPCDWEAAPFGKLPALPRNAKPITTWNNQDEAFLNVAIGIRRAAEALQPGRVTLEMVAIPGGTFLMGSPENEPQRSDFESPQHPVTIRPFFLGKYPVTQAQWQAVAALPQVNRELDPNPSRFKGDDRPVEQITWYDAVEFCDRISQHTGKQYRLPSEAEWEYACRATTTAPFHFGETITTNLANYNGKYTYGSEPKGTYRDETTPVSSFGITNAFGLSDMHGNVWEWCADRWYENYEEAPINGSAWVAGESNQRVLRGGSWNYGPHVCRSAYRSSYAADGWVILTGFRVACSA